MKTFRAGKLALFVVTSIETFKGSSRNFLQTKTFLPKHYPSYHNILYLCSLRINRPIPISVSSDSCRTIIKQLSDDNATVVGRLVSRKKKINLLSDKNNSPKRRELFIAINKNNYLMSAYYDLYETPSPDGKEDKKSLHSNGR